MVDVSYLYQPETMNLSDRVQVRLLLLSIEMLGCYFWDTAGIVLHALMLKKPHQFSQTVLQHCIPPSVSAPVTLSAPPFSLIGQLTHA